MTIKGTDKEMENTNAGLVHVGTIGKAHGMRGEVKIIYETAHPDHMIEIESIWVNVEGAPPMLYKVEWASLNGSNLRLKLHGVDDRNTAEALRGASVLLSDDMVYETDEDEYFVDDLIGMDVVDTEGGQLGRVIDVLAYPAHDIYVIKGKKKDIMVPAVHEYIREVDMDTGTITITVIDGLTD